MITTILTIIQLLLITFCLFIVGKIILNHIRKNKKMQTLTFTGRITNVELDGKIQEIDEKMQEISFKITLPKKD